LSRNVKDSGRPKAALPRIPSSIRLAAIGVKILGPTAITNVERACGSLAICALMRLTARLPGPNPCKSPQSDRVGHELRPPALATPARRRGSGRPQVGGLPHHYIRVAWAGKGAWQSLAQFRTQGASAPGKKASHIPIYHPYNTRSPTPRLSERRPSIDERYCRRIRPADDVFGTHRTCFTHSPAAIPRPGRLGRGDPWSG
jgi:hypothetical protein